MLVKRHDVDVVDLLHSKISYTNLRAGSLSSCANKHDQIVLELGIGYGLHNV